MLAYSSATSGGPQVSSGLAAADGRKWMSDNSLLALAAIAMAVLVMMSLWREILKLIVSLIIAIFLFGLDQILHFFHR